MQLKKIAKKILKLGVPYGILLIYNKIRPSRRINYDFHSIYGKYYFPHYNNSHSLPQSYPDAYNKDGRKIDFFFIHDEHLAHSVYSDSKYFQYDRYNFGLDTHFYTHQKMLEVMGKPLRKYGMLIEAEIICPNDYLIFERNPGLEKNFDKIFTYSDDILQKLPNSRYVPYGITPWYKNFSPDNYYEKTKNISMVASNKKMVPLHEYRNAVAMQCKTNRLADIYGTFDGGQYCDILEPFKDYRFSIVIENELTAYGFTEKITNCFAAMTIPVYLGATRINNIFNPDGIIQFNMKDNIEKILKGLCKKSYEERVDAVIDNFNKVNINKSAFDIMYESYIQRDVGKLNPGQLIKAACINF